jgi:predicted  nucleic acid-binding Zn-ribbon protein
MSLSAAVKAMVRTNLAMSELDMQESRLARNVAHMEKLRRKERAVANQEDITEEDMSLYYEMKRWEGEVADAEKQVEAWKAELTVSRSQFFSVEEVAELKTEGALTALLNKLERTDAAKIPMMLQKNGADFISVAKWAIKDRYFWNGMCPW